VRRGWGEVGSKKEGKKAKIIQDVCVLVMRRESEIWRVAEAVPGLDTDYWQVHSKGRGAYLAMMCRLHQTQTNKM
jgi:hypothetical protein